MKTHKPKKCIIDFNHISNDLSEEEIQELKDYYIIYHKKCWCYKKALKRLKKYKLAANILSLLFASGGIVSSIVTNGIALVGIAVISLVIQSYKNYKSLDMKIYFCDYSYKSYQHLLNEIKEAMRSGHYDNDDLINKMKQIDDVVTDHSIPIDKLFTEYDEKFTC